MKNKPLRTKYTLIRNDVRHIIRRVMKKDMFDWRNSLFETLYLYLKDKGYNISIEHRKTIIINKNEILLRDSLAVICNNITGEYILLDCHDWVKPEDMDVYLNDSKCRRILKCQYNKDEYNKDETRIKPWTYFDRYWPVNEAKLAEYRNIKPSVNKLYFRGQTWNIRDKLLNELITMGLMNADYHVVDFDRYLKESKQHIMLLSLPGVADVCHRDIEGFASGVCVLRPKIKNSFHNGLIPDYHYLSVDIDMLKDDPAECASAIKDKFEAALMDKDKTASIADNAVKWYEENVTRENALKLTHKLLEMD